MNTRQKATKELVEFLVSDEKCVLLTGTYQNEKHILVFSVLRAIQEDVKVLFRVNNLNNAGVFLGVEGGKMQTGKAYSAGNLDIFVDSINDRSWNKTPRDLDYAILYPIDGVNKDSDKKKIIEDLFNYRNTKKIFLVSWTDNRDFGWLNDYIDRHIIFDAEEENPEYQKRMQK
ncbi:hypothetical protein CN936_23055 [Bacillus cereus]|uniref:hypothetical protein n=1 Tax=Bacillus cereus TaxID=1396 RepID=UPI000BF8AFC5|nr:hypothetical protein [Bacillus cereus]AVR33505.1 hypothetical protein FORC60_3682 [Bacillus cereus]PFR78385.1 hypothetical protein COK29_09030 [Bacillus cereus]PGL91610.1 hypothetical protein CN936_23055 [Bacillus cereus]